MKICQNTKIQHPAFNSASGLPPDELARWSCWLCTFAICISRWTHTAPQQDSGGFRFPQ